MARAEELPSSGGTLELSPVASVPNLSALAAAGPTHAAYAAHAVLPLGAFANSPPRLESGPGGLSRELASKSMAVPVGEHATSEISGLLVGKPGMLGDAFDIVKGAAGSAFSFMGQQKGE